MRGTRNKSKISHILGKVFTTKDENSDYPTNKFKSKTNNPTEKHG